MVTRHVSTLSINIIVTTSYCSMHTPQKLSPASHICFVCNAQAAGDIASTKEALLVSHLLSSDFPLVPSLLARCSGTHSSAPQNSASACELLMAVASLGHTLQRHQALEAGNVHQLHRSTIETLSEKVRHPVECHMAPHQTLPC